ncbi:MAG: hypothetical protein ACREPR_02135, partial [Brasilonema sp.]
LQIKAAPAMASPVLRPKHEVPLLKGVQGVNLRLAIASLLPSADRLYGRILMKPSDLDKEHFISSLLRSRLDTIPSVFDERVITAVTGAIKNFRLL